jgi:Holliday junction DNA helicase RuvA
VVVDVNGVGYGVNISAYTAGKLPETDSEVLLYTTIWAEQGQSSLRIV